MTVPNFPSRCRRGVLQYAPTLIFCVVLAFCAAAPAQAQETGREPGGGIQRIEDAELIFEQGIEAFEAQDYGMAYRRFRLVYNDYPLNRKTTAALLMAGKSLYRDGRYARAADVLSGLVDTFPTSSYVDEARRTLGFAEAELGTQGEAQETIELGIALPLDDDDALLTQALFNGIRLAVEEMNERPDGPTVRMVFEDTGGEAEAARAAVRTLAEEEEVDAIIGPLYSREARAAAAAAEDAAVVLVAPLATDEDVAEGRRYVFQANPTITMRGRLMADFARRGLRLDGGLGVASQFGNSESERMAEGFQEQALEEGDEVVFFNRVENVRAWPALADSIGRDTLSRAEAIYLPLSGSDAPRAIRGALSSLSGTGVRILGNSEWHDRPIEAEASRFQVTYTNDFYLDETRPEVQSFIRRYREATGDTPDALDYTAERLAYTGYDVARYLLEKLARSGEEDRPLHEVLREAPRYDGLGIRIDFDGGNVNQALFYHRYRNGQVGLLR